MRQRTKIVVALLAVVVAVPLAFVLKPERIQERRCKLRLKRNPDREPIAFLVTQWLLPLPGRPDGIEDVPANIRRPSYYHMAVGGRKVPLVVDFSGTLRMCLDADGDGKLSNERCYSARLIKSLQEQVTFRNKFGTVSLAVGDGEQQAIARFSVFPYRRDRSGPLRIYPAYYRDGKMQIEGQVHRVALVDGNYDGRYDSTLSLPIGDVEQPQCDLLAIDFSDDGQFQAGVRYVCETMPLSRMIRIGDVYYEIDVTPDGGRIELRETQPEMGELALDFAGESVELELWSDAARQLVSCCPGRCELPTGRYKVVDFRLSERDPNGDMWTMLADTNGKMFDCFDVRPGQSAALVLGPPFTVRTDVRQAGNTVTIGLTITGRAGEFYSAKALVNDHLLPRRQQPALTIVDEEGNVLVTDRFQYG